MRVNDIIEGTIVLVALYLIVTNGSAFSNIISSIGSVYTSGVKALQGR